MIAINNLNITEEELKKFVLESKTKKELTEKLGFSFCNGRITKIILELLEDCDLSIEHFDASYKRRQSAKYKKIKKICPVCNKDFFTKNDKKETATCSYKCSNTFFYRHTEESKNKISEALIKYNLTLEKKPKSTDKKVKTTKNKQSTPAKNRRRRIIEKVCLFCEKKFITHNRNVKYCSNSCCSKVMWQNKEYREDHINKAKERAKKEDFKGWASRSKVKPSFPETYVMELLKLLNITNYMREYKAGRWFIDFAIVDKKLALEIDGAQHKLPERKAVDDIKDNFLIENGWKILRIPWKRPTKEYREELIVKISNFFS